MNEILKLLFELYVRQASKLVATIHKEHQFTKTEKLALHFLLNSVFSEYIIKYIDDEEMIEEANALLEDFLQKETVH